MINFDPLYKQVNEQISQVSAQVYPSLNPVFAKTQTIFTNANSVAPSANNPSYPWTVRVSQNTILNPGLLSNNTFFNLGIQQSTYTISSTDGNLTIANMDINKIYLFSANIQRYVNPVSTSINLPWGGPITVILNGATLLQTSNNSNGTLQITLAQGTNTLEILLYTNQSSNYFTINSNLAQFADNWSIPIFDQSSSVPQNVTVINDANQANANTFISKVTWNQNTDGYTYGYRVYRKGPYDSTIGPPLTLSGQLTTSGSLSPNTTYYYAISSISLNGESLPFLLQTGIQTFTQDPQVSLSVTGYSAPGTLGTGFYYYGISLWGINGNKNETTVVGNCNTVFNPSTSANLTWIIGSGTLSGVYGWAYPSGYKIYRDTSGVFNTSSLLTIITGIDTKSYIDIGNSTTLGSPQLTSQVFSGIGINLQWSLPSSISSVNGYYLYRSSGNQYIQNSMIQTINSSVTTGLWDSGYIPTSGVPTQYRMIADILYPTNRYDDVGVKKQQTYTYKISSYNSNAIESSFSSEVTTIAGNSIAPSTPSGILVITSDSYATLSWQNGTEIDLEGTKIAYSTGYNGPYTAIDDTLSTSFTKNIGYSTTSYFQLANFNTAGTLSSYSTGVSGITGPFPLNTGNIQSTFTPVTAKAWVLFSGTATTGIIVSQYNVSQVNRQAQGVYRIEFTTPMSNSVYAPVVSSVALGSPGGITAVSSIASNQTLNGIAVTNPTKTGYYLRFDNANNSFLDPVFATTFVFGL